MLDTAKKIVYLPSGGISYSPVCYMKHMTNESFLLKCDADLYNSLFEYMFLLLNAALISSTPIEQMYLGDFYYLWALLLTTELNGSGEHTTVHQCNNCKTNNNAYVNFANVKTIVANKYRQNIPEIYTITENNINFNFRMRKVNDNIIFGNLFNDTLSLNEIYIYFLITQLENITYKKHDVPEFEWVNALQYLNQKQLFQIISKVFDINHIFGFTNTISYYCPVCNCKNIYQLFDDIILSYMMPMASSQNIYNLEQTLNHVLNSARLPMWSMDDILKMPITWEQPLSRVLNSMKFTAGHIS